MAPRALTLLVPIGLLVAITPAEEARIAASYSANCSQSSGKCIARVIDAIGVKTRAVDSVVDGKVENLLRFRDGIYSGGEPKSDEAFSALAHLGIKTIISVDGAKPKVDIARANGLRYVHIPIGYEGISDSAADSLTRAARECKGPLLVHCHHGRHRAPAAAAIFGMAQGAASNDESIRFLKSAGTSRDYAGLWRSVAEYRVPPRDAALPALMETAKVDSLTTAMVDVNRAFERLQLCRDAGWQAPEDHPDLVPAREALLMGEGFHEASRAARDDGKRLLQKYLARAERSAVTLEHLIETRDFNAAAVQFEGIEKSCRRCHETYRN